MDTLEVLAATCNKTGVRLSEQLLLNSAPPFAPWVWPRVLVSHGGASVAPCRQSPPIHSSDLHPNPQEV